MPLTGEVNSTQAVEKYIDMCIEIEEFRWAYYWLFNETACFFHGETTIIKVNI